jgi:RNA polymerase sigma factor (sigma-70 family)
VTIEERNALIEAHLGVAREEARAVSMGSRQWLRDDLTGEAYLLLVRAADEYDPARGVPFSAWARRVIRWRLHEAYRRRHSPYRAIVICEVPLDAAPEPVVWPDEDARIDAARTGAGVRRAMEPLPPRERRVIELLLEDRPQSRAMREFGVNESRVSQIKSSAFRLMRERLAA